MSRRRSAVVLVALAAALVLTSLPAVPFTGGPPDAALADTGPDVRVFVNEIHYANDGVDAGEFVEIAGPAGADLSGYEVVLYGADAVAYATDTLTGVVGDNGVVVVDYPIEGMQDGLGGVALVEAGQVAQFLSWGGELTAADGPAAGRTSTDIGVVEATGGSPDESLQLTGAGDSESDFEWSGPAASSRGAQNHGQGLIVEQVGEQLDAGVLTDAEEPGDVVTELVAPSDPANELLIEGESLVPTATGTIAIAQGSTGNLVWSGNAQLRVNAAELFDSTTVTFQVPRSGRYVVAADMTQGPNFGVAEVALDGAAIAQFDGRPGPNRNILQRRRPWGVHELSAGPHTLTMTAVQATNDGQVRMGLDLLRLRLQPSDGRLLMTPWRGETVAGEVPVFAWSTDVSDELRLEADREGLSDWDAMADTATLVYEAVGMGVDDDNRRAEYANRLTARGYDTAIDYKVANGSSFVTNGIQVSGELLQPGSNTITISAGQVADAGPRDRFTLRNVELHLADGTILRDPTKPVGTQYRLGDTASGVLPSRQWTYTISTGPEAGPERRAARSFLLDTNTFTDADHVVTAIAEGSQESQRLHHRFVVDNDAPEISNLSPAAGTLVKGSFLLDATVTDIGPTPPEVVAALDGDPVALGSRLDTDDLADGPHTFTVVATDASGASDEESSTFTSVGETPDAPGLVRPADGASGTARFPSLAVTASDPAGEPLQVTFLRATPAEPPVMGRAGTTDGEVPGPAVAAGSPVDLSAVARSDNQYVDSVLTSDEPYQLYDVRVSKVRGAKTVDLSWEGRVAADRVAVLSVWNVETQRWTEVTSARGTDGADTTLVGSTRLGPAIDGDVVHLLVEAKDPFDPVPSLPDKEFEDVDDYAFSIAWITDTQYLSQGAVANEEHFGPTFTAMTQWVKANATQRKIVYSAHTGDVINNWQVTSRDETLAGAEYDFASEQMEAVDSSVPNGVTPGNHDNKTGANNDLFNEYFPPSRYEAAEAAVSAGEDGEGYYGGPWQPGDNQNHYDLVESEGVKLLFLYLGYGVKADEVAWANDVLAAHRDRKAVVLTHSYLTPSNTPDGQGGELTTDDGQTIFDEVVQPNPNVFLTLSGHTHGVGLNIKRDVGTKGHVVVEMLANQQFYELPEGDRRVGPLRLLQVDLAKGQISVNTYSPFLDRHNPAEFDTRPGREYTESADEFVVPVDLPGRTTTLRTDAIGLALRTDTVIGTTDIASGAEASITWSGLAAGTRYGWYARATDPQGVSAESSVFTFTTGP